MLREAVFSWTQCCVMNASQVTVCLFGLYRYGQLSGMVEPLAGLFGAVAVVIAEPLLPYTLAFAAGAMIYVVFDDIIPESQTWLVVRHKKYFF